MANFVTNIVHFDGDPERILDLRGAVQDDQYGMSGIDFNKIIPMPSGLWMGGINPDTRAKYGKNNWLDWSVANWGTKWNAFRFDDDDQHSDSQITFVTANNAPAPIMQKLSEMYPDITMRPTVNLDLSASAIMYDDTPSRIITDNGKLQYKINFSAVKYILHFVCYN